jgi:hypothetical protein
LKTILYVFLFVLIGCQENKSIITQPTVQAGSSISAQSGSKDNFDDLEKLGKDEEACATEEEIKENFKPKPEEKPKAFKLQGGDPGCAVDGEGH